MSAMDLLSGSPAAASLQGCLWRLEKRAASFSKMEMQLSPFLLCNFRYFNYATNIFVPARQVPTGSGELVDGKGEWVYDYSDSQTKSTWVVPKVRVYESVTVPAHYECPHCGYSSR